MLEIPAALQRLPIDPYLLMLLATVDLAAILPARGEGRVIADGSVTLVVALLFILYGARLSPAAVWSGLSHWRLQLLVLVSTFCLFPLLGLGLGVLLTPFLQHDLLVGLIYLCLLPILFPGYAVGLIVLPLMLFHQAQLFVCAPLARRYALRGVSSGAIPRNDRVPPEIFAAAVN